MSTVLRGDHNRCSGCGEPFNSTAAHHMHRVGAYAPINRPDTRRCLTADQMIAKGMQRNAAGLWITAPRAAFARIP